MSLTSQPHSNRTHQVEIFRPKRWREFWLVRQVTCSADGQLAAGFPRGRFITYANLCLNIHRIVFRGNWFRFEVKFADFGGKTKIGQWQRADQVSWSARVRRSAESWLRQRFHVFGGWSALGVVCLVIGTFNQFNCCVSLQVSDDGNRRKISLVVQRVTWLDHVAVFSWQNFMFFIRNQQVLTWIEWWTLCVTIHVAGNRSKVWNFEENGHEPMRIRFDGHVTFFAKFPLNFNNFDTSRH